MEDVSPMRFDYQALPARVLFGAGRRRETPEVARQLGCAHPLIVCTPEQKDLADTIASLFTGPPAHIFPEATMHTPWNVTSRALALVQETGADSLIAVGGGSAIGLAKALALRTGLPQIALPTTYAGSEVTPIIGETQDSEKRTRRTLDVLPEAVIYDVELTLTLPARLSATSGLNAMAHAVEALYSVDANPVTSIMAEQGIAALAAALPEILANPASVDARNRAQYGAWLCGTCLGSVGMALHHKVCHVLGGTFDLPHADTHAIMLAHVVAYQAGAATHAMRRIAHALEADDAWSGLHALAARLHVPQSLAEIGMPHDGIGRAADLVLQQAYANPRTPGYDSIRAMLERAWRGAAPQPDSL
ncbi:maleylacetate reductase [Paraburkholderia sp. BL6665CI2N2]|uniref:maleylacetate reductase n=1 Tax=Paraburkholderia sp. BL6665CI2N2 TaxID=1938806 RepID=UPI001064B9E0|nr:maleylacetate reductase [Paraburkholderia sp. BL6665CI2N2]TDY20820.1 maleylacetate reductase [Paraburkholderia sp. BL6665CI2N2]